MFQKIVVGVDGRRGGRDAIALARALASESSRIEFVHVVTPRALDVDGSRAHAVIQMLAAERDAAGLPASPTRRVEAPDVGAGLHRVAEEAGATLIVVGAPEPRPEQPAIPGEDARATVSGAPCAVAIAQHGLAARDSALRRIGAGYDGSPSSAAALALAHRLTHRNAHAQLTALRVIIVPPLDAHDADAVHELVAEAHSEFGQLDGYRTRTVAGDPRVQLAEFSHQLDLLALGARGYGPVRRLVLGATTDHLLDHASCSLLIVPLSASGASSQPPLSAPA